MKSHKLIYFLLVFAVIVAAADFTLAFVCNKLYQFNRYGMSGGNLNYYLSKESPETLIMGSSRAHQNLIPDSISKSCFNLSHNGMSVAFQAALADVLRQKKSLPKQYLILQIEPGEMMVDANYLAKDIQHLKYYYYENTFIKNEINEISRFEFLKYYFRSYKYNGTFFSLINNSINTYRNPPVNQNGYDGHEHTERDSLLTILSSRGHSPVEKQPTLVFDAHSNKCGLFYLSHIIDICREENIALVVFTAPYYVNPVTDLTYMESFYDWLKQNQVPYLDYSHREMTALKDPRLWSDVAHLNIDGARIFSHIFANDFKQIYFVK